ATDASGHAATATVAFTIDLQPPTVTLEPLPPGPRTLPKSVPFAAGWVDSDDDGASGSIVREVLFWDGCPLFDGASYGTTHDGLLSNETIRLDRSLACRALEVCGVFRWTDPVLKIEVTDCGGNSASDQITIQGRISVSRDSCAGTSPARSKQP